MGLNALKKKNEKELKWPKILLSLLSTIGVVDTATITLDKLGLLDSSSFCLTKNGCDIVLSSAWGNLFYINENPVPLSLAGLITYSSLLIISLALSLNVVSSKSSLNRLFWWLIFLISCGSSTFSLILVFNIMMIKLNTYCTFCILSAIISFSIFILSIIGAKFESRETMFYRAFIVIFTVLIAGLVWSNNLDPARADRINQNSTLELISPEKNQARIDFAKYLTMQNVVMYSAWYCSHCQNQKNLFGKEAIKELTIVECADKGEFTFNEACKNKEIEATPSWEIGNQLITGTTSLKELAELTGYKGNTNF